MTGADPDRDRGRWWDLVAVFLRLGLLGFGGPAAHLGMLQEDVVRRRRWLTEQQFLDLIGATHLIPGPNSTEMAIHIGLLRGRWRGMLLAGGCFILPAVLITVSLAWFYVQFGSLPQVQPFLAGLKPAVLGIILVAVLRLGRTAVRNVRGALIGLAVATAVLLGAGEVTALAGGAIVGLFVFLRGRRGGASPMGNAKKAPLVAAGAWLSGGGRAVASVASAATGGLAAAKGFSLLWLGIFFLKVGAVLYGGGYVLVAFLEGQLVHDWGWLSEQQLLDAIAIGQFTPGPILCTATFIGYLLAEANGASAALGATVATVCIFLPSFFFVLLIHPFVPRLRKGTWTAAFLDAVNVSAVGLMAVATIKLGRATLIVPGAWWLAWGIALAAVGVLLRWKVHPAWVVLGGALLGWLPRLFG